jgi:hypothetical protein
MKMPELLKALKRQKAKRVLERATAQKNRHLFKPWAWWAIGGVSVMGLILIITSLL